MTDDKIIVYGADWCPDCRRARKFFDQYQIEHTWVNIDNNADAEQLVMKLNRGYRSVPTIVFPDGSILVEPSTAELETKFFHTQKGSE